MVEPMTAPKLAKLNTHYWAKPIPDRSYDWSATYDDYDGAEDSSNRNMIGYGKTEAEAIADLVRLYDEEREYREHCEAVR
jgi:hypothetical protein